MHYIRFLSIPRIQVDRGTVLLKAVLTITTDLGETFYPEDLELVATIRDPEHDGDIYLRRRIPWKGSTGARSVPVKFDMSHQDVEWPACMHVSVANTKTSLSKPTGFLPPIVDVWSSTLNPTKGHMTASHRVQRRFTSSAERDLVLEEDAGDSIARHLWDGSQVLAQHFDQIISLQTPSPLPLLEYVLVSATYRRLHVLELGCGCGTVGLSLAQAVPDTDVVLTDLPDVRELVESNISRLNPAMASRATFQALDWETLLPPTITNRTNDLIIVSECTYNTDTLLHLTNTLAALVTRSPKAIIVVATKTRHESEAQFFALMAQAGLIEDGRTRVRLPGLVGTGYGDGATDVGLHVFHGKSHRVSLSPRGSEEGVMQVRPGSARSGRRKRGEGRSESE
ncbi:uncharacterized protein LTR77_010220 [Saxophila tyrrhenica]|uniref:Uncharacterized protein n=1 Tax=Saxophila tyrrhenica TaxID=1690608 RepID=A0AAV9NXX2_9PEZI|nr:hypothetical protein LTR77_010220 [Saxophila tyrrhenica]